MSPKVTFSKSIMAIIGNAPFDRPFPYFELQSRNFKEYESDFFDGTVFENYRKKSHSTFPFFEKLKLAVKQ